MKKKLEVTDKVVAVQQVERSRMTVGQTVTPFAPVGASGGTAPIGFAVTPALPEGSPTTHRPGRSPAADGREPVDALRRHRHDAKGLSDTAAFVLAVASAPAIAEPAAVETVVGAAETVDLTISGGVKPYACAIESSSDPSVIAPADAAFETCHTDGRAKVAFTAKAEGEAALGVLVTDANGVSARQSVAATVRAALTAELRVPAVALTARVPAVAVQPVVGVGGSGTLRYAVAPRLPRGLAFDAATGTVSGKSREASAEADYTVTVRDARGSTAAAAFRLAVSPGVDAKQAVASVKLVVGTPVTVTPVTAVGGTGALGFTVEPALPDGLVLDTGTGTLSGALTGVVETTRYRVTVRDSLGSSDVAAFRIASIKATQTITFAPVADAVLTDGPVALEASASSGLPVAFASTTPAVCTIDGTSATPIAVGTCRIRADQPGDATYAAAPAVARSFKFCPRRRRSRRSPSRPSRIA